MINIFELESKLLDSKIRTIPEELSLLISDDFVEFGSSGNVYYYKPSDIFSSNPDVSYKIIDFTTKELSPNIILAMYKVIKMNKTNNEEIISLRSSIWKRFGNDWKIAFHQGTNIK